MLVSDIDVSGHANIFQMCSNNWGSHIIRPPRKCPIHLGLNLLIINGMSPPVHVMTSWSRCEDALTFFLWKIA